MKRDFLRALLAGAVLWMGTGVAGAQIEGPPALIDYQGRVLDGLGQPIAAGGVENIEIYFRIWNHISDTAGANLLWAEKQVVTVADGNFSVRLGEGAAIESSAGDNVVVSGADDPRPSLLEVFGGKERFLGLSVAPNSTTKPQAEIQPRLAFLTSPYAAVAGTAKFAEFGPSSGIFEAEAVGVGTSSPGSLLEVVGSNSLGRSNGAGLISAGSISGPHLSIDADDIQKYDDETTPGTLYLNYYGGSVSIGTNDETTAIYGAVNLGVIGKRTTIRGDAIIDGNLGIGIHPVPPEDLHVRRQDNDVARVYATGINQGGGMFYAGQSLSYGGGFFYEGDGEPNLVGDNDRIVFFRRDNGAESEVFSYPFSGSNVNFSGNVGIGTTSPTDRLQLGQFDTGNSYVKVTTRGGNLYRSGIKLLHFNDTTGYVIESDERPAGPRGLHFREGGPGGSTRLFLEPGGNFGIGKTNPGVPLHVKNGDDAGIRLEEDDSTKYWDIYYDTNDNDLTFKHSVGAAWFYIRDTDGTVAITSDRRMKKDIEALGGALDKLEQIPVHKFRYKAANADVPKTFGFIAQDVEEMFPELVEEKRGIKNLVVSGMVPVNTRAIQELSVRQGEEIAKRDRKIEELEKRLERLESLVEKRFGAVPATIE